MRKFVFALFVGALSVAATANAQEVTPELHEADQQLTNRAHELHRQMTDLQLQLMEETVRYECSRVVAGTDLGSARRSYGMHLVLTLLLRAENSGHHYGAARAAWHANEAAHHRRVISCHRMLNADADNS